MCVYTKKGGLRELKIAIPVEEPSGLDAPVSMHFGRAPFYAIVEVDLKAGRVLDVKVIENVSKHFGGGGTPAELLAGEGVEAIVVHGLGAKALALFQRLGVKAYRAEGASAREVVERLLAGELKPLSEGWCPE